MAENPREIAVITGGSSGIRAILADRLVSHGLDIVLVGRDSSRLHIA